jgi:hypothetical protein
MRRAVLLLASIATLLLPAAAPAAPATTMLEISDQAYTDLEKLCSFRLCRPPMIDQRPLARGEFARVVAEAIGKRASWEELSPEGGFESFSHAIARRHFIDRLLGRLTGEFREELIDIGAIEGERAMVRGHPAEELRLDAIYASSAPLRILPDNGYGTINAVVNPFLDYREGRLGVSGFQEAFEIKNRFSFGRHVVILFTPRFEANSWYGSRDVEMSATLQEGYATVQFGDAAMTFGRQSFVWGPGEHGSLLLSNNARPLDAIAFSTPSPFRLPWVFRHLGEWRLTMMGANLGPEAFHKYAWLGGWRLTYRPVEEVEIGFGHTVMMGGEGVLPLSAIDVIGEYFGFRPAGSDPGNPNKSNHMMEASILIRIPPLAGMSLYGVLNNEDKRDSLERFLRDGSSYLAGVYFPRLSAVGKTDLRLEFRRMSAIHYRHSLYADGHTINQMILGDDLGPDALGFHAELRHDFSKKFRLTGTFDWELRRADIHGDSGDPDGSLGDIIVVAEGPHERRYRAVLSPWLQLTKILEATAFLGYERVENAGFVEGISRNNWLAAVNLRFRFDPYFRFEVR